MITISNARFDDIDDIVSLHNEVFAGFFLTSLGGKFLMELYSGFTTIPGGVMLIARDGAKLVGFAAGTTDPLRFFPSLRRQRGFFFFLKALPAVLRNPVPVVRRLFAGLFYRGDAPQHQVSGALLSSIGVASEQRGNGLADRLLYSFEREVAKYGSRQVYLTTDADHNERVNTFYRKNGYKLDSQYKQGNGRLMYRYIKNLE